MTAIVMKVTKAIQHPDALRLYKMSALRFNDVQIIANLDNIYQEEDHVIIVLSGSKLKDGTVIRETKIRGIASYGMALGKTDLAVGTNVTPEYCTEDLVNGFSFIRWPSIESFFNIRRNLISAEIETKIIYQAKIKLDGTNAGVQVSRFGESVAQSKTKIITVDDDNMGFAKWLESNKDYFNSLSCDSHLTIFGEFCGKGIQKKAAITQIDKKIFAVFAIQHGGIGGEPAMIDINPVTINNTLKDKPDDIFVLPWYDEEIQIDWTDREKLKKQVDILNDMVTEVENCDPWVKETFGIEGIGEGIVMYPFPNPSPFDSSEHIMIDAFEYSELVFKAKGEKHKVVKTKKAVQIDPEIAESVDEFVTLFVTEERLDQIISKFAIEFDVRNTGTFLKEFSIDVKKESEAELDVSGLTWKEVAKSISAEARKWFITKCKEI